MQPSGQHCSPASLSFRLGSSGIGSLHQKKNLGSPLLGSDGPHQCRRRRPTPAGALWRPWTLGKQVPPADADLQPSSDQAFEEQPELEKASMKEVDEVFENQRLFFGFAWKAPLSVLDWPEWSDAQGNPVAVAKRPTEEPASWQPSVTASTDAEGWQYATVFKHLEYKRPGGRSSARFGDTVRRRLWRRRRDFSAEAAPAVAVQAGQQDADVASTAAVAAATAAVEAGAGAVEAAAASVAARASMAAYEAEARKKAVKAFLTLALDLLSRRQLWSILPWDPAAMLILYKKHQQVYQELQTQAYERRLFTADQPAPPSQLREGRTLLQDLLCAAMHSRAAYGYPMAAGYVNSVASYIKLQTLQPLTFDAVGGVSVEANNESVAALAGIAPSDILMSEWRNSPYRPCHYVAIDSANQCIVISIRGSLQVGDLLSDISAGPMEVDIGGADGWVHQGIFAAATYIHCSTQAALQEAARRCPGWPLLITGHSLGGGAAALLTLLLQQSGLPEGLGPLRCITMGTAAVVSKPLAEACNDLVTSVIVGSDVVPHLSYASVEALLLEASQASPVRRTVQDWGSKLAGALRKGPTQQQQEVSTTGLSSSWLAVKEASARLGKSASKGSGLAKVVSLINREAGNGSSGSDADGGSNSRGKGSQRTQAQQQEQQQLPRMIPVLDFSKAPPSQQAQQHLQEQQQQGQVGKARAPASSAAAPQAEQQAVQAAGSGAEAVVKALPAADAIGLEGFFADTAAAAGAAGSLAEVPSAEQAEAPAGPTAAEQRQQHQQAAWGQQGSEEEAVLPYFCQYDSPLADAAVVQEEVAASAAAAASAPAPAGTGSSSTAYGDGGAGGPGDPELLYPPGRIIWIFPADEDLSSGAIPPEEAEQKLAAMDVAWQGAADPLDAEASGRGGAAADQQAQQAQRAVEQQAGGSGPAGAGSGRGHNQLTNADAAVQGQGAVNIEEAVEVVGSGSHGSSSSAATDAGGSHAAGNGSNGGGTSGSTVGGTSSSQEEQAAGRVLPVAVDADRSSFERLLLMPDMLNDHLPDRYLDALQQL